MVRTILNRNTSQRSVIANEVKQSVTFLAAVKQGNLQVSQQAVFVQYAGDQHKIRATCTEYALSLSKGMSLVLSLSKGSVEVKYSWQKIISPKQTYKR